MRQFSLFQHCFWFFVLVSDCKSVSLLSLSLTSENSCLMLKSDLFNKTFM